jgi:hypothetical protein
MKCLIFILCAFVTCKGAAQTFCASFMGTYSCKLTQTNIGNGSVNTFNNIVVTLTASSLDTSEFKAYDGISLQNSFYFTLYSDSTFKDSSTTFRYGQFYDTDSIYIYHYSPGGGGGVINKYWGLKISNGIIGLTHESVLMYPNPAHKNVTLKLSESIQNGIVEVFDLSGKNVMTERINSEQHTLNVSQLENGFYLVQVKSNGRLSGVTKMVVEK